MDASPNLPVLETPVLETRTDDDGEVLNPSDLRETSQDPERENRRHRRGRGSGGLTGSQGHLPPRFGITLPAFDSPHSPPTPDAHRWSLGRREDSSSLQSLY